MIEEKNSYFPAEVEEIVDAYSRLRECMQKTGFPACDDMDSKQILEELKMAQDNYDSVVPINIRKKLTGILFE